MTDENIRQEQERSDGLARLLRAAGRRPEPPRDAYEETLALVTATWQAKLHRRRLRIRFVAGTLAAGLACAAALLALLVPEPATIARPDRLLGTVEWQAEAGSDWSALPDSDTTALGRGSRLRTATGSYAGLRLAGDRSLRLARNTEVRLTAMDEIELISGTLYVDSGRPPAEPRPPLAIVTPAGRAIELGTQFEVSYRPGGNYRLRVREGLVRLVAPVRVIDGAAGSELRIDVDGRVAEASVDPASDVWDWVLAVAPIPVVDGRPVTVLLDWVSRETGRALRYAPPELREHAKHTTLHGHIGGLSPLAALDVLLATTDLAYAILEDGTIEVRKRNGS